MAIGHVTTLRGIIAFFPASERPDKILNHMNSADLEACGYA